MIEDINTLLTQNPNYTDEQLVTELGNLTTNKSRMISQDMIMSFLIQNQCLFSLINATTNELAQGFWLAISSGVKEFNVMNGHPVGEAQKTILSTLVADGVLNTGFESSVLGYANYSSSKYPTVTLKDVKAARYPASWQPVTIASGNDKVVLLEGDALLSNSNKGGFRFNITPAENFTGQVQIRISAKKYDDTVFTLQSSYPINVSKDWTAAQAETHIFQRAAGLAGYRHFQFEFIAPYDGAVSEVSVEGLA